MQRTDPPTKPIFLVGMPGSGKTTIGRLVADELNYDFFDCDQLLELKHERTISEIFAISGEAVFRDLETDILTSLTHQCDCVIATGGGVVLRQTNRNILKRFPVIFLEATLSVLLSQTSKSSSRPLLQNNPRQTLQTMLEVRSPLFEEVSNKTLHVANRKPSESSQIICRWIREQSVA